MARLLRQQQLDQVTFRELVEGGAIDQSLASTTRRRVKQNLDRHRRTRSSILPRPVPTGTLLAVIYLGSNHFFQTLAMARLIDPALFVLKWGKASQFPGHEARGHAQAAGRGPRGAPAAGHRTAPARDDLPGNCRSG